MAKVGRNDPCPCGSGKKYKRCHGSGLSVVPPAGGDSPRDFPLPDPRALERTTASLTRLLDEQEVDSPEVARGSLQGQLFDDDLARRRPASPLEEAQDLMYDAWEAQGAQRVKLARKALQVSPDCADAYVLLAQETARSPQEELDLYARGVAAGERALGKRAFREDVGHFWGLLETRPYMRARAGLAQCLWGLGRRQEAIQHYWDMLRLNPGDNQGLRYVLLGWLLEAGDQAGAKELLERYAHDGVASWPYGRALHAFREQGDIESSRTLRAEALEANRHAPPYLLGTKQLPKLLPDHIGMGDENEAIEVAVEQMAAWRNTPGALAWLTAPKADGAPARAGRQTAAPQPRAGQQPAAPEPRAEQQPAAPGPPAERQAAGPEPERVPREMRPRFEELVRLTDAVCREHLDEEYAQLCRRLAAALCRKRPSPVVSGRAETWACAIAYAIGSVNFLFDKTQVPHLTAGELCARFGVSPSTGAAKASQIRKMFRMEPFDPDWYRPSKVDDNPLAWMISVNGLILDARYAPREIQEEALRRGLIPYLPETHG